MYFGENILKSRCSAFTSATLLEGTYIKATNYNVLSIVRSKHIYISDDAVDAFAKILMLIPIFTQIRTESFENLLYESDLILYYRSATTTIQERK